MVRGLLLIGINITKRCKTDKGSRRRLKVELRQSISKLIKELTNLRMENGGCCAKSRRINTY